MFVPLLLAAAMAATSAPNHVRASLVSRSVSAPRTGDLQLALHLDIDPQWHVYWRNAGAAGLPPRIEWISPSSARPDSLRWPLPDTIPVPPLMTYGYSDSTTLPFVARVAEVRGDSLRLEAMAHWQTCKEICLLEKQAVSLTLPVSNVAAPDPAQASRFERVERSLPGTVHATSTRLAVGDSILVLVTRGMASPAKARLFPVDPGIVDDAASQRLEPIEDGFRLTVRRDPYQLATRPDTFAFVVALGDGRGFEARMATAALEASDTATIAVPSARSPGLGGTLLAVLFAFLGGILLNLMPCVLPVLSLKVLDILKHSGQDRRQSLLNGASYVAGVVLSFLALAGVLLMLRAGGSALGWGFQMQSPPVVALLSGLMLLIACNLWGVFEPGAGLARVVGSHRAAGFVSSFVTGLTATVVATPCTAPFMGAALGYTLARPAFETIVVFAALGLGLSAPLFLVTAIPSLGRFLPRPGAWMESLKQALGFAMAATAAWLGWLLARLSGSDVLLSLFGLWILVAVAAWVLGRWALPHRSRRSRILARIVFLALLGAALAVALRTEASTAPRTADHGEELWHPGLTQELRASGKPWFLHFTADWCLSCQVNEKNAFADPRVEKAFRDKGIRRVKADWTARDTGIANELARFGRQGIPFYVLSDGVTETVLPEVVTPGVVLDALAKVR